MIFFYADDHFGTHAGKNIWFHLPAELKKEIVFRENEPAVLEQGEWVNSCSLLILHTIGGTCGLPHAGLAAEKAVRAYCEQGGNILLLHGSSAAFWQWRWWREIVGLRWVRPGDPDKQIVSTHPVAPCTVKRVKSRHALVSRLRDIELPEDEIYTELEETAPVMNLMTADVNGKTFVQCCETVNVWHGRILSFIPGHKPESTSNPDLVYDIQTIIQYLLKGC